ncbi:MULTISPECIES: TetR/AcrR family transcriptional regulator [Thiomicrorhabdus]|uniref:TetR/AcrR family transcriptional regulator n=1 Tax=Thiomicrorhabdus heinhorstiae TaxID=2748010 RepID=A0ABS0BYJ9_9GAMM|nr:MULTISPECIES: TetR/AcrR family transcriptional regulator [Thiomicrorhabdus]MBF6058872.1 TetR/AcrR family transcriptional regulator [Thiomicrorhabdus heinhorstiae]
MTESKENSTSQRILKTAAELFASKGYDALSMRDIASACDIKAPSLYNHFKDKQALYQATLKFVFKQQSQALVCCLESDLPPKQKLNEFIEIAGKQMADNFIFRQLFFRILLAQDEEDLKFLANQVLADSCNALHAVFVEINPDCDPHFLTTSLMGLLLFHFQANPLRIYLPAGSEQTQASEYLIEHIQLMLHKQLGD